MGVCDPPSHAPTTQTFRCKQTMTILTKEIMNQDQTYKNDDDINAGDDDDDDDDEDDNKYSSTTVLSHDPDRETWSPQRQHAQSTSSTTARPTHTHNKKYVDVFRIDKHKHRDSRMHKDNNTTNAAHNHKVNFFNDCSTARLNLNTQQKIW